MDLLSPNEIAEKAKIAFTQGDFQTAMEGFSEAAVAYQEMEDKLLAAEMRNNLSVTYLKLDRPEDALESLEGTSEVFKIANDQKRFAMSLGNQASVLDALGKREKAEPIYLQAAKILKDIGEEELHAHILQSLSSLQLKQKRPLEAVVNLEGSLDAVKRPSFKQRLIKKLIKTQRDLLNQ